MANEKTIGVIGGSGLYQMEGMEGVKEVKVKTTPFGPPSDSFVTGRLGGARLVFLPRHGRGHRLLPSEINFRANLYGMKVLGVDWIIAISAVGSMREEIRPGHIVVPDQFFDRTKARVPTFFGGGIAGHVAFADPVCPDLASILYDSAVAAGATVHKGGTYICMEGPQFSTRAESRIYRQWGVDVIGMTNIPEAKLAREAEICYATLALSTDYDCWHEHEEDVTIDAVLQIIKSNTEMAKRIVADASRRVAHPRGCICANALENAILTDRSMIPQKRKRDLAPIIGKYVPAGGAQKKKASPAAKKKAQPARASGSRARGKKR